MSVDCLEDTRKVRAGQNVWLQYAIRMRHEDESGNKVMENFLLLEAAAPS